MTNSNLIKETIVGVRRHQSNPNKYTILGDNRKFGPLQGDGTIKGDLENIHIIPNTSAEKLRLKELKKECPFKDEIVLNTEEVLTKKVKVTVHVKNYKKLSNFKTTYSYNCYKEEIPGIILQLTEAGHKIIKILEKL